MPETVGVGRRDSVGARVGWSNRVQLSFRPGQADGFGLPQFRPYLRTQLGVFTQKVRCPGRSFLTLLALAAPVSFSVGE